LQSPVKRQDHGLLKRLMVFASHTLRILACTCTSLAETSAEQMQCFDAQLGC